MICGAAYVPDGAYGERAAAISYAAATRLSGFQPNTPRFLYLSMTKCVLKKERWYHG